MLRETEEFVDSCGTVSFRQVAERVADLENRWRELNLIPTNSELFRRIKKVREANEDGDNGEEEEEESAQEQKDCMPAKAGQPVYDMWQKLQMMKQIEVNTDGISKVQLELLSKMISDTVLTVLQTLMWLKFIERIKQSENFRLAHSRVLSIFHHNGPGLFNDYLKCEDRCRSYLFLTDNY
jgi:hypothetical protein